jgi:hypothetical protein
MKAAFTLVALLLCLWPATSYGQGNCTLQNIVGTYALTSTGASTIVAGTAPDTFHWEALYGPIALVGVINIKRDGTADGKYWLVAGAWNLGLDAVPWQADVTLNSDCTGEFVSSYEGSTLIERFVVLGNGREIRSVATQTAVPTGNWLSTAHRIDGSPRSAHRGPCGQHKVHGDYLFECKNIFAFPPPNPSFAGAIHIRMLIAPSGDYTATVYGKVGPDSTPFPAFGHLTVHDDCTAEGTLESTFLPTVSHARGVFFNEGKQGYWLPLANELPDGSTVPQPYAYCVITKVENK